MKHLVLLVAIAACGPTPATTPAGPPPAKTVQVNEPGKDIDLASIMPRGYVTVVDFWAESCGACHVVGGMLAVQVAKEDRVVIRKVDVGDGFTPVAEHNQISALPHYKVFDKHQRLRADLVGNDCLKAPEIALALAKED